MEKVQSEFLCRAVDQADKEETIEMKSLKLPADLVEGSARAWVSVTGDILAPALANLDGLVTLPTGCGEQNMITLVPNIFLLEYLNGTGKVEPKLEDQVKAFLVALSIGSNFIIRIFLLLVITHDTVSYHPTVGQKIHEDRLRATE